MLVLFSIFVVTTFYSWPLRLLSRNVCLPWVDEVYTLFSPGASGVDSMMANTVGGRPLVLLPVVVRLGGHSAFV